MQKYGSCITCYFKKHPIFNIETDKLTLQICPRCFKFRNLEEKIWHLPEHKTYDEIWTQAIYYFILNEIKNNEDLEFEIEFIQTPEIVDRGKKKIVRARIAAYPSFSGSIIELEKDSNHQDDVLENNDDSFIQVENIIISYSIAYCQDCARVKGGYHNSVIQLRVTGIRSEEKDLIEEILLEIQNFSSKHNYHGINPISSIDAVQGGFDIMLISKNSGRAITSFIKKHYCVTVKESFKIIKPNKETGGNLKRLYYSIRLYPFFPGDILIHKKNYSLEIIISVKPDQIHTQSLTSGMHHHFKPENLLGAEILLKANSSDIMHFQVLSISSDNDAILINLDTYKEYFVKIKPWYGNVLEGAQVKGFFYNNDLLLLPSKFQESELNL